MARVLISFLGKGMPQERRYKPTKYQFVDDNKVYESPFIAKALCQKYNIDKVILIGTVKSMWEEVYYEYAAEKGILDENTWIKIGNYCQAKETNYLSDLYLPYQEKIEEALGEESKIILVKYGINQEEIEENEGKILQLEKYLDTNDKLVVDITHAFRSLPIFLMNCLMYVRQISNKKIEIEHISYGMLEAIGELKYAPIVELKSTIDINDWITGAYSFKEYGNAYKLANILERNHNKSLAQQLRKFSNALNMNYIKEIEMMIPEISALPISSSDYKSTMIFPPIIQKFKNLKKGCKYDSQFQLNLAKWHFDHMNYSSAYLLIAEAIVTYVCEQEKINATSKETRDEAKNILFGTYKYKELNNMYSKIGEIRNQIAHSKRGNKSSSKMISILESNIKKFEGYVNSAYRDNMLF